MFTLKINFFLHKGYGRDGGKEGLYEYVKLKGLAKVEPCFDSIENFGPASTNTLPSQPVKGADHK